MVADVNPQLPRWRSTAIKAFAVHRLGFSPM